MADRQVIQPSRVRVRHVKLGTGPGQVTVLGQTFVPSWDGINGRGGWISGTLERRLYEEGTGALRLPNAAGDDGRRHIDRLACLSDPGYAPGDEWFEVYQELALIGVFTPTGVQRITRTDIELAGGDAVSLLRRTREGTYGYWAHAPRDVLEHYGRAWRSLIADGFDAQPRFTYDDAAERTTADGLWKYWGCQDAPGACQVFRAQPSGTSYVRTAASYQHGTSATDRYRPWRVTAIIEPVMPLPAEVSATLSLGDVNIEFYRNPGGALGEFRADPTAGSVAVMASAGGTWPRSMNVVIEGRDRWVYFEVDGVLLAVLPMPAGGTDPLRFQVAAEVDRDHVWNIHALEFRQADRLLVGNRAGDMRIPGSPAPGGLWGEYFDLTSDVATFGVTTGYALAFRPGRESVAARLEPGLGYSNADPPGWRPAGTPANSFCARFSGSVYLDLDARDYALRVTADDQARLWIGSTRGGEHLALANVSTAASPWLKAGSSSASAPSGTSGALAGQPSGWYPIVVEYIQTTGAGGITLEWESSSAVGTWSAVPAAKLSPYGIHRDLVRNESHYDAFRAVADAYGFQWTCEPRSLESGEFPGRITPSVRVGRDTEKRLGEGDSADISAELDLDSRADDLQADASGISDPTGSAQLSAEMLNYPAATQHLILTADYESLSDITSPELLRQRLTTLLALRASPWQTVSARPPGRRELLDSWPLTGALAEFAWAPGDGIRLDLPAIGVVDQVPRQILGVSWAFVPDGMGAPSASFRPRPKSLTAALRDLRRVALQPQRNYQQQLAQVQGTLGTAGAYVGGADTYSRVSLPPDVTSCWLVVLAKSDASAWTVEANGQTTTIAVTAPGRYDVTAFMRQQPGGYNYARMTGGTGSYSLRLEATVRV